MSNNNSSFVNKEIHLYDYLKEECRHTLIRSHFAGWAFFPFTNPGGGGGGKGVLGLISAGYMYVPLISQSPFPSIVYSVVKHRPYLSHFWEKQNFCNPILVTF